MYQKWKKVSPHHRELRPFLEQIDVSSQTGKANMRFLLQVSEFQLRRYRMDLASQRTQMYSKVMQNLSKLAAHGLNNVRCD
eukprot:scaffold107934_cov49-Prasinocladus_malaysianus.AAC.1